MLDAPPPLVHGLVCQLLLQRQLRAPRFLRRHEDLDPWEREREEPQILQEPAPRWQGIRRRVRNRLIVRAAAIGIAEEKDDEQSID